jgi:lactose/L-arabinose transport system permease protein
LEKKLTLWGWFFVAPASMLIFCFSFMPMIQAAYLSLHRGIANNLTFNGINNYFRLMQDAQFKRAVGNVFIYLIIVQVPIMLLFALILASILNNKNLPGRGFFRTLVFYLAQFPWQPRPSSLGLFTPWTGWLISY